MSRKFSVGDLPDEISATGLQEPFSRSGIVESVSVMRDQMTGHARGFGFVEMTTHEGAQAAVRELSASHIDGCRVTVHEARPMAVRTGGSASRRPTHRGRPEPRW